MEQVEIVLKYVIETIEYIGVLIVVGAAAFALFGILARADSVSSVRRKFAEWILAGLEFIIAAEIIKATLVFNREELLLLGAVVIIRSILGYSLGKEISKA